MATLHTKISLMKLRGGKKAWVKMDILKEILQSFAFSLNVRAQSIRKTKVDTHPQ